MLKRYQYYSLNENKRLEPLLTPLAFFVWSVCRLLCLMVALQHATRGQANGRRQGVLRDWIASVRLNDGNDLRGFPKRIDCGRLLVQGREGITLERQS